MINFTNRQWKKVYLYVFMIACLALGLTVVLYSMDEAIIFFYTPTKIKESTITSKGALRLGGIVKEGSIINIDKKKITFVIHDRVNEVQVIYEGSLPSLFDEGQGVVVQGKMDSKKVFFATQVLAKHDENYRPVSSAGGRQ